MKQGWGRRGREQRELKVLIIQLSERVLCNILTEGREREREQVPNIFHFLLLIIYLDM